MTITPEKIAELRALEAKATKGPWDFEACEGDCIVSLDRCPRKTVLADGEQDEECKECENYEFIQGAIIHQIKTVEYGDFVDMNDEDAAFICSARNALPALLDEVERLQKDNAEARNAALEEAAALARDNLHHVCEHTDLHTYDCDVETRILALRTASAGDRDTIDSLLSVLADIREAAGVGIKPMLSDLAETIGRKLALLREVCRNVRVFAECDCAKTSIDSHWNDVLAALKAARYGGALDEPMSKSKMKRIASMKGEYDHIIDANETINTDEEITVPRSWLERLVKNADAASHDPDCVPILIGYASSARTILDMHRERRGK